MRLTVCRSQVHFLIPLSCRVMTGKAAKLRNSPPYHSKISSISCLNTLSVDSPHDCESPLLPVVVGGRNHVLSSHYDQANIALSVLRGFICQRTEHLCTCAAEHSSGAEVTSD